MLRTPRSNLNSFIDTLTISRIRYLVLYLEEINVLGLSGRISDIVREICENDLPLPDTDGDYLDNIAEEQNIEDYKSEIFDILINHSNFNKIISDFKIFYKERNLVSIFIHKFSIKETHLEDNARLIYWLWGHIQKGKQKLRPSSPQLLDKYNDIINHLLSIDYSPNFAKKEVEDIYIMHKENLNQKNEEKKFLNKENISSNYLELKSDFVLYELFKMELEQTSDILDIFSKEINNSYYSCIAIFDLIEDKFLRENLIFKLSRRWSDRKHREKMKKKNIFKKQISLNKETLKKLSKIEEHYRCNSSEAIAKFIDNEYDKLF